LETYPWLPAEDSASLARIAKQEVNFRRPKQSLIDLHILFPVELEAIEDHLEEVFHRMGFAGGDYVVVRIVLLEHHPHCFDIVARESPIAFGVEIAQSQRALQAYFDSCCRPRDLSCDKVLSASR